MSWRCSACWSLLAILFVQSATAAGDERAEHFFEKRIRPILISRCYECHSEQAGEREGGLWLDRRDGLLSGGERGPALVPGDPDASLLIQAVRRTIADLQMPPDTPLPDEESAALERWVALGAADPRDGRITPQDVDDPSDPIVGREHWAFHPLKVAGPPALDGALLNSPIDAFVLSKLHAAGLEPVETADRRTLLRRVSFQLVGLPPTPQQLAAYLSDSRPDAYERVVDRLLGSPQFGERWGRHWLDLARYADSNGLDENFLFREAWRYRNWVINAVNEDVPFERFLLEQLAGDLLPYDSVVQRDRQRIAAGFLVVGPKVLLGNNGDERRMDVADEQLDTIGRAILGQTLGCARCHDHKFDPIPTADYYALAGIMTSTQVMQRRHMLNQQRLMERLVGLGADGDELNAEYETFWREQPEAKKRARSGCDSIQTPPGGFKSDELEAFAEEHPDALAAAVKDDGSSRAERIEAQKTFAAKLNEVLSNPPPIPPRAMIPADVEQPCDEAVRIAGQFDAKSSVVPRGFLRVLGDTQSVIPADKAAVSSWRSG